MADEMPEPVAGWSAIDKARNNGHRPAIFQQVEGGPYVKCLRCAATGDQLQTPCGIEEPTPGVPEQFHPELTRAEELGLVVAAAYGTALAERDQAVGHLRTLLDAMPVTSFAQTNIAGDAARAWLEEYDATQTVGSAQTPEQETAGP